VSSSLLAYEQSINTLRVFLSSGDEIADVATGGYLFDLVLREDNEYIFKKRVTESILPSQWLLRDVVPAVEPYLLGEHWWEKCLLTCIRAPTYHPCFEDTLRKCTVNSVRNVLIMFIYTLKHDNPLDERKHKEFQMLAHYADGFSFVHAHMGKTCSPLSIALESGNSFLNFRELLRASTWDLGELIRREISMEKNGWTEETMQTLFKERFTPYVVPNILEGCKTCASTITPLRFCWDYPWLRQLRRVKERMDISSPPDEEETRYQDAWEMLVTDSSSGRCLTCCVKKNKKRWPFLVDLPYMRLVY